MLAIAQSYVGRGEAADVQAVRALLDAQATTFALVDRYTETYPLLGIDQARELRERASLRPVGGIARAFVLAADAITHEAQNALLKLFEEPPASATFVLLVPEPEQLLATLRSRMQPLALTRTTAANSADADAFLAAQPAHRLTLLASLLDTDERDPRAIRVFVDRLEESLARYVADARMRGGLAVLYRIRRYLADKGALLKPLLETLALTLPVV